jgi:hypothetical protein
MEKYVYTPFDKENMLQALSIMWKGMMAIFIVITIIAITTFLVNLITIKIQEKKILKTKNKDISDINEK